MKEAVLAAIVENGFLKELLTLQQDGRNAISSPSNWREAPLLEIETELDSIIADLRSALLSRGEVNKTGRWHFFIGSPGNGKSAAVGKLYRALRASGCRVETESGEELDSLGPGEIPYLVHVYEPGKKFVTVWFAQDASVVKNPFAKDVDPSRELLDLLREAWGRGVSLVVCTNWGVIEKAFRRVHTDTDAASTGWFKALKQAIESGRDGGEQGKPGNELEYRAGGGKKPFDKFSVSSKTLDNRSLLVGSTLLAQLVEKATAADKWSACAACPAKARCPFKQNRDWLATAKGSERLCQILSRAEVLSGQVIVFREALALVSFLLAGCPRDYLGVSPCQWVQDHDARGQFFALLTRRVYASLFASYAPCGLEYEDELRTKQRDALRELCELDLTGTKPETVALKQVVKAAEPVSTDVGVTRLLGPAGVMRHLDPLRDGLPLSFYGKWDGSTRELAHETDALVSELERKCFTMWADLENRLEGSSKDSVPVMYRALRRWISAFTLRLGAVADGRTAFGQELDLYLRVLDLSRPNLHPDEKKELSRLEQQLVEVLAQATTAETHAGRIPLSETVQLQGPWAESTLRPKIARDSNARNTTLAIRFGASRQDASLGAEVFVWLERKAKWGMDLRSFPAELLAAAADARARAAARSDYASENDNVELVIKSREGARFVLRRFEGDVVEDE